MKKRITALIICFIMAFLIFPVTAAAVSAINSVSVAGLDMPAAGTKFDFSVSVSGNYTVKSVKWQDRSDSAKMSESDTAVAGRKYRYDVELVPNSGYAFLYAPGSNGTSSWQYYSGTAKINGTSCIKDKAVGPYAMVLSTEGYVNTGHLVITGFYTVPVSSSIKSVSITGLNMPTEGAKFDTAVSVSGNFTVKSVKWQDTEDLKSVSAADTAVPEHKYRYDVELVPKSGYAFPYAPGSNGASSWQYYSGSAKINGTACITDKAAGPYAMVLADDGYLNTGHLVITGYHIVEDIPAPVIISNPASVDVKTYGSAEFKVSASGDGLHYQWLTAGAGMPREIGADSDTLKLKDVTPEQYDGCSFWCVVTNEYGSISSEEALLSVIDPDYVFPFTDVTPEDWFYNDVRTANRMKLIDGKSATLFCPDDNMTYAQAVKLAACMNQYYTTGEVTLENGSTENGVPWYGTYVEYAKTHGIPWEFSDYGAVITRSDFVYIFYYALPSGAYTEINEISGIPDVGSSDPCADEIYAFYKAGILSGSDEKGTFSPGANIRRSEVAAVVTRMLRPPMRKHFSIK